jgi:cell division protein ZapB
MNDQSNATPVNRPKNSGTIILLSVIIGLLCLKIFWDYREKSGLQQELTQSNTDLGMTKTRLEEIKAELDNKITEISRLGGNIEELKKAKEEVEATLKKTKSWSNKNIKELKERVQGYEKLLKMKDEELAQLKEENKELYSENNELKSKQNKLNDSLARLSQRRDELAGKVAIASRLKAENIRVFSISQGNREKESPFRSRRIGQLKIQFNLAENRVAPIEGKKILIRIIDENNQVIFDLAKGSGTFTVEGREEWYTAAQEILFDNTKQELSFLYEKGSDYNSGNYTVEIYAADYKMGSTMFIVK